jgi:endonuclease/exonuclease/phosphatase family metal-dependent hydrolase
VAIGGPQFHPVIVNRTPKKVGSTLNVVALNARGGIKADGIIQRLRRPPLANADIILLCEAAWRHRFSGYREFAAEVAKALQMSFAYLPQFKIKESIDAATSLGSALLCKQPLGDVRGIPIPTRPLQPRVRRLIGGPAGLVAKTNFNGRVLNLGVVHLNSRWTPEGREEQMTAFLAGLESVGPMVIGGDFNTTTMGLSGRNAFRRAMLTFLREPRRLSDPRPWEGIFKLIGGAGFDIDSANVPGKRTFTPTRLLPTFFRPNLDWLAVRDLKVVERSPRVVAARTSLVGRRVSDHDFISCEIQL